jgi:hypothetical protein
VFKVMTDGILSGRGNGRDQFGRGRGHAPHSIQYASKIGIPLGRWQMLALKKSSSVMHHNNWRDPSDTARLAALKRYLKAKPARPAEDYRAIPLVLQALDAFGVRTDCLRPRVISRQARAS